VILYNYTYNFYKKPDAGASKRLSNKIKGRRKPIKHFIKHRYFLMFDGMFPLSKRKKKIVFDESIFLRQIAKI